MAPPWKSCFAELTSEASLARGASLTLHKVAALENLDIRWLSLRQFSLAFAALLLAFVAARGTDMRYLFAVPLAILIGLFVRQFVVPRLRGR